nr:SIS domain-containing protein [Lysinibacter cavernae]
MLELLRARLPELRKSEQKVAQLVIEEPSFVVSSTMASLAEAAGVSEPTVMRFCTGLGIGGFQAFKMKLAQALAIGLPTTYSSIARDDSVEVISTKVFDHTISSLDRARGSLDAGQIEQTVQAILEAQRMTFIGLGASGIIALDAEQKESLFGIPCSAPVDSHQQFIAAAMAEPGQLFFVISNTGRTDSINKTAEVAAANGATVIGITGEHDAPLLKHCQFAIVTKTFEDTDVFTPTVSRLAGLVLIDILATAVAARRGTEHLDRIASMKEGLARFRTASSEA